MPKTDSEELNRKMEELNRKMLKKQVIEIFDRYNFRDDIENELQSIGFEEFFGDPDEKIYFTPNRKQDILIYVNWIDSCFYLYERTEKLEKR